MRIVVRLAVLAAVLALSVGAVGPVSAAPSPALPPPPGTILGVHEVKTGETLDCIGRAYTVDPNACALGEVRVEGLVGLVMARGVQVEHRFVGTERTRGTERKHDRERGGSAAMAAVLHAILYFGFHVPGRAFRDAMPRLCSAGSQLSIRIRIILI